MYRVPRPRPSQLRNALAMDSRLPVMKERSTARDFSSTSSISAYERVTEKSRDEKMKELQDRMIRVDHAGEYGANRIYAGQMAVLGRTKSGPLIQHMWDQEKEHLRIFETLLPKYRARPTVLLPFWNVAGFVLGAGTALLGDKAAMACTVAVEATIIEHYNNQIRDLMAQSKTPEENQELLTKIQKCRDEEQEHHDTGLVNDAEQAPVYGLLTNVIKTGCKTAIWLSERI